MPVTSTIAVGPPLLRAMMLVISPPTMLSPPLKIDAGLLSEIQGEELQHCTIKLC